MNLRRSRSRGAELFVGVSLGLAASSRLARPLAFADARGCTRGAIAVLRRASRAVDDPALAPDPEESLARAAYCPRRLSLWC